ncbi:MAG: ComEC/Rec2 family competence protein [Phycisphaeraceae bacterium]|nr:ComEC/Rec2 family competence protein [Phycisphaeraceae bacterium]
MGEWRSSEFARDAPEPTSPDRGARVAAPALCAFACVIVGMVASRHLAFVPAAMWFALACGGSAVASAARGRGCAFALALAAAAFGGGWFALRVHERGGSTLDVVLAGHDGSAVRLRGVIVEGPEPIEQPPGALGGFARRGAGWRCELSVDSIAAGVEWRPSRGVVRLVCEDPSEPSFATGQRIEVLGEAQLAHDRRNPGMEARPLRRAMAHEAGFVRIPDASLVSVVPHATFLESLAGAVRAGLRAVRTRSERAIGGSSADPDSALLAALILGTQERALDDVRGAYTRVGLAHLLAISGFHLVVMTGALLLAIRLTGDRGRLEPALAASLIVVYLLIVPGRAPVIRAGVMVLALLMADAIGRRYHRLAVLAWICVGLLLWRPMDVFALGFQLSAGLTALLLWIGPRVQGWGMARVLRGTLPTRRPPLVEGWMRVRTAGAVALACWLVALPMVVHVTGLVSVLGVVSTLLVGPVIVAALWFGYSALVVGLAWPQAGEVIGDLARGLSTVASGTVARIDAVPMASVRLASMSLAWALAATLVAILWVRWVPRRSRVAWVVSGVVLGWGAVEAGTARLGSAVAFRMDTLDVGDGSCHLLRSADQAALWDCGASSFSFGRLELPRAIRALGAGRVERVIISHPNLDHYNALLDAIEPLGVREVVIGEAFERWASEKSDGPEAFTLSELARRGVEVRVVARGDRLTLAGVELECLWPERGAEFATANDGSLVLRVVVSTHEGERRVLLTGDSQDVMMQGLSLDPIGADVLELPHHGSFRPASEAFVEAVDPGVVVQSTGPARLWDNRWARVRIGRAWLVTARDGACSVEVRRRGEVAWGL